MTVNNLKLGVDVVSAYNLKPKGGQGSTSAYVELFFDGQSYRTTVKDKDLSPVWDESFYFSISDPSILQHLNLEAYVYSTTTIRVGKDRSLLGKVSVSGTSFVPRTDAVVLQYPLKKCRLFSWVRGKITLKVYITDDPSVNSYSGKLMQLEVHPAATQVSQVESEALLNPIHSRKHHHDHFSGPEVSLDSTKYEVEEMRDKVVEADAPPPKIVRVHSTSAAQPVDIALKDTQPYLGGGTTGTVFGAVGSHILHPDKRASTCDLVARMDFLYVSVVKARDLPIVDITESLGPFVEVRVGNYKGVTKHINKNQDPGWNVVFAFSMDRMLASVLYVVVKYKHLDKDDTFGIVRFDLNKVPMRVPPDSPLAPQWYCLEDSMGERTKGELMLTMWTGTQADEAFHAAWHFDAAIPVIDFSAATYTQFRPMVYHAPTLWYARVTVIEAQELQPSERTCFPEVRVKAQIGNNFLRTKILQSRTLSPLWNDELLFVVSETSEGLVVLTVENRVSPGNDEILGSVTIPLSNFHRRADNRAIPSQWYNLEKPIATEVDQRKEENFCSKLHLRLCLDGGYHVLDESTHYSSDLRPSLSELCKTPIGVLDVGILGAEHIYPMKTRDGRETSDTYCIAKYGKKWIRTRTILDSLCPQYNEQYSWEIFDRATVLTVGAFDNNQSDGKGSNAGKRDLKIGKVEIRLSALETGRVYTHFYPLMDLQPTGFKLLGRLHLAIRFSCTSFARMLYQYTRPLLPRMHYVQPISIRQREVLRYQAVTMLVMQFGRAEPVLRKEVVEYMSEVASDHWSMRRSKANFFRLMAVLAGLVGMSRWFGEVCLWRNPITTVLVHILFLMLVRFPLLILPMMFLYMFLIVVWNYQYKPKYPPYKNKMISQAEACAPDELDEEFDTYPTSRSPELVRMRYDRLRSVAGRLQKVAGDVATQGERLLALVTWKDPYATAMFGIFCLIAAVLLYVMSLKTLAVLFGLYAMRHPWFRSPLPALPFNFLSRLPDRTNTML